MIKEPPLQKELVSNNNFPSFEWAHFFSSGYRENVRVKSVLEESGTTANRPTTDLWVGRRYFDTTLGKPVYAKSLYPTVWVDGAGTTV